MQLCALRLLGRNVFQHELRQCSTTPSSATRTPDIPDYNTPVDTASHKLTRPTKLPKKRPTWDGLTDLAKRTKGSLIPSTLQEFSETMKVLKDDERKKLLKEERKKRQRTLDQLNITDFLDYFMEQKHKHTIKDEDMPIKKKSIEIIQANIGLYCNQACSHCHVESSPRRKEMMSKEVARKILDIMASSPSVHTLDITGGAPELCPEFRYLVEGGRALGKDVIDRCNLTSLLEPGQEDTARFLSDNGVHIVASLPCYSAKNVNTQRGQGVFDRSIQALLILNSLGYASQESQLKLDLIYNPLGGFVPPPQAPLEEKYRQEMRDLFSIEFNQLFTMTNMPIKRFNDFLHRRGELQGYMELLIRNYNINTMSELMCYNLLNVCWDGQIYDCDFNQQLELQLQGKDDQKHNKGMTVFELSCTDDLIGGDIAMDNHCFGCTAGMGSS